MYCHRSDNLHNRNVCHTKRPSDYKQELRQFPPSRPNRISSLFSWSEFKSAHSQRRTKLWLVVVNDARVQSCSFTTSCVECQTLNFCSSLKYISNLRFFYRSRQTSVPCLVTPSMPLIALSDNIPNSNIQSLPSSHQDVVVAGWILAVKIRNDAKRKCQKVLPLLGISCLESSFVSKTIYLAGLLVFQCWDYRLFMLCGWPGHKTNRDATALI